jgi:hypothetical protein
MYLQFDGMGFGKNPIFSKTCKGSQIGLQISQFVSLHFLIYKLIKSIYKTLKKLYLNI